MKRITQANGQPAKTFTAVSYVAPPNGIENDQKAKLFYCLNFVHCSYQQKCL